MKEPSVWPEVAAKLRAEPEKREWRHLTLIAVIKNKVPRIARMCAWCRRWNSAEDYRAAHEDNAKVSHGMCDKCAKKFLEQMAAINDSDVGPEAA